MIALIAFVLGIVVGCVLAGVSLALWKKDQLAQLRDGIAAAKSAEENLLNAEKLRHDEHVHAKFAINAKRPEKSGLISLN